MEKSIPYKCVRYMYFISEVDDQELLKNIVLDTVKDL